MLTETPRTIDVHAHALSSRLVELTAFTDVGVWLETMDRQRIDMQVVSDVPNFGYWADRQIAEQVGASQVVHGTDCPFDMGDRIKSLNGLELRGLAR